MGSLRKLTNSLFEDGGGGLTEQCNVIKEDVEKEELRGDEDQDWAERAC